MIGYAPQDDAEIPVWPASFFIATGEAEDASAIGTGSVGTLHGFLLSEVKITSEALGKVLTGGVLGRGATGGGPAPLPLDLGLLDGVVTLGASALLSSVTGDFGASVPGAVRGEAIGGCGVMTSADTVGSETGLTVALKLLADVLLV